MLIPVTHKGTKKRIVIISFQKNKQIRIPFPRFVYGGIRPWHNATGYAICKKTFYIWQYLMSHSIYYGAMLKITRWQRDEGAGIFKSLTLTSWHYGKQDSHFVSLLYSLMKNNPQCEKGDLSTIGPLNKQGEQFRSILFWFEERIPWMQARWPRLKKSPWPHCQNGSFKITECRLYRDAFVVS